jgi:shikimate kinase
VETVLILTVMNKRHIVIVGFMGTGKTTIAVGLAAKLGCRALDLDDLITQREKRGPKEIIEQDGEEAFRRIETRMLHEILLETPTLVLAVGGGAWTVAENRKLITERGALTVWLDAPFELCWKRIEGGGKTRPLAQSRDMAEKLYAARRSTYELADVRILITEELTAEDIVTKVARVVLRENANS